MTRISPELAAAIDYLLSIVKAINAMKTLTLACFIWLVISSGYGFYVVNWNGVKVAGPFQFSACSHYAEEMSHHDVSISPICRLFSAD